jgi:hypothetical protein
MRALLTGECKGQEWRAVEGEYVYIVLSKESNCWAKMQNPDKVLGGREPDMVRLKVFVCKWI